MEVKHGDLQIIFKRAFNDNVEINELSSKENMELWDSINHLNLIIELEDFYSIKLTTAQIESIKSIDDIITTLENINHVSS